MNAYEVLGLGADASEEEVRAAYLRLATLNHPDRGGDGETFRAIREAYEQLSVADVNEDVPGSETNDDEPCVVEDWIPPSPPKSHARVSTYKTVSDLDVFFGDLAKWTFAIGCLPPLLVLVGLSMLSLGVLALRVFVALFGTGTVAAVVPVCIFISTALAYYVFHLKVRS